MPHEQFDRIATLIFYHGTTQDHWDRGDDPLNRTLSITTNLEEALTSAEEESNIRMMYENFDGDSLPIPIIVVVPGMTVLELIAATPFRDALQVSPDWK